MNSDKKQNRHSVAMKRRAAGLAGILIVVVLTSCSNEPKAPEGVVQNVQTGQEAAGIEQETEIMADDLPGQQGEVSRTENAAIESHNYEGEYNSYDIDEPALEIKKEEDGTYRVLIDLFRLYSLDDGIGKETEGGLEFAATGPGGNDVSGVIQLDEDSATVTIFGQEWLEFAGLSEYRFYKTSDAPNMQEAEDTGLKAADEILDSFINGSISAVDPEDLTSAFYMTDLNMDSGEWDSFSVGEKADLDNDGENELVINGPYGGIYLDARDNRVYQFAAAEGTALTLSYTWYNGAVWILYSNRSSAGFEYYHMEKYEGADNLVAEMNFGEEFDINNPEAGVKYTLNGNEITCDEYTELCSKIFAAQVSTDEPLDFQDKENNDGQIQKEEVLEILTGEYEYLSDHGIGKLIINKTSQGYDISDYESESSYRFLADSSNIDVIRNNKIYIKYPEQVFSDGTVIFCYYILEYDTDEINVYYARSVDEEGQFLYRATRKSEEGQ